MARKQTNGQQRRTPSKRVTREERRNSLAKRDFNEKFEYEREVLVKHISPKNPVQADFLDVMRECQICIGRGSAGTGKSYLAASFAANEYLKNSNLKLYLSRPYVPMGRSVGLLPGTEVEKISPFLVPLTNVLKKHLGHKYEADFGTNIQIQLIETIRGVDLEDAILIVDEAQNLTKEEMKSVVTRLSRGGKIILIGDTLQSDLKKEESGLDWLIDIVRKYDIKGVDWVDFRPEDCVRSGIVKEFLMAFDQEGI